jgi:hypothetical protein
MFASMLMFCEVTNPRQLWDAHWESLSDDIEAMTCYERVDPTVTLSKDALKDRALYEIDQVSCATDIAWKIFQRFPSLITSLLFMEQPIGRRRVGL